MIEVLKGDLRDQTIVVRELGGEKDGVGMNVAGSAQFSRGQDVVVMLNAMDPDGFYDVKGMMMGRYDVVRDEGGGEYLTGPGLGQHPQQTHHESQMDTGRAEKVGTKWTISALRTLIQDQEENHGKIENPAKKLKNLNQASSEQKMASALQDSEGGGQGPEKSLQNSMKPTEKTSSRRTMGFVVGAVSLLLLVFLLVQQFRKN